MWGRIVKKHLVEIIIVVIVLILITVACIPLIKTRQEQKQVDSFNEVIDMVEIAVSKYINDNIDNTDVVNLICDGANSNSWSVSLDTLVDENYLETDKLYNYCLDDEIDITLNNWSRVIVTYNCLNESWSYYYREKITECPEYF